MLVAMSGAVKALTFGRMVDCGFVIKAEARTATGGYIIKPSQLRLAGVPRVYVAHLLCATAKDEHGKVHKNVCYINQQFITQLTMR